MIRFMHIWISLEGSNISFHDGLNLKWEIKAWGERPNYVLKEIIISCSKLID